MSVPRCAGLPGGSHLSLEPELEGGPVRLSLARGETAELPCRVRNLGDRHIIWRRGFDVSSFYVRLKICSLKQNVCKKER